MGLSSRLLSSVSKHFRTEDYGQRLYGEGQISSCECQCNELGLLAIDQCGIGNALQLHALEAWHDQQELVALL